MKTDTGASIIPGVRQSTQQFRTRCCLMKASCISKCRAINLDLRSGDGSPSEDWIEDSRTSLTYILWKETDWHVEQPRLLKSSIRAQRFRSNGKASFELRPASLMKPYSHSSQWNEDPILHKHDKCINLGPLKILLSRPKSVGVPRIAESRRVLRIEIDYNRFLEEGI